MHGTTRRRHLVLGATVPSVSTTLAAIGRRIRDEFGALSHPCFRWTRGSPVRNPVDFVFQGRGEIAPVMREMLRETEPDLQHRPSVHVG